MKTCEKCSSTGSHLRQIWLSRLSPTKDWNEVHLGCSVANNTQKHKIMDITGYLNSFSPHIWNLELLISIHSFPLLFKHLNKKKHPNKWWFGKQAKSVRNQTQGFKHEITCKNIYKSLNHGSFPTLYGAKTKKGQHLGTDAKGHFFRRTIGHKPQVNDEPKKGRWPNKKSNNFLWESLFWDLFKLFVDIW